MAQCFPSNVFHQHTLVGYGHGSAISSGLPLLPSHRKSELRPTPFRPEDPPLGLLFELPVSPAIEKKLLYKPLDEAWSPISTLILNSLSENVDSNALEVEVGKASCWLWSCDVAAERLFGQVFELGHSCGPAKGTMKEEIFSAAKWKCSWLGSRSSIQVTGTVWRVLS